MKKAAIFYRSRFFALDNDEGVDELSPLIVPDRLTNAERLSLRNKINAGELLSVRFRAVVFGDEPNLNGTRTTPGLLQELAADAVGRSFVYDHDSSMDSKVGRIIESEVIQSEGGVDQLVLLHEVFEPSAMLDLIMGKVDEFSIALSAEDWVCSLCDAPAKMGFFGPDFGCSCYGDGLHPELFGTSPVHLLHNAAVTQGAYRDTGFLSAYSAANRSGEALLGMHPLNAITLALDEDGNEIPEEEPSEDEAMSDEEVIADLKRLLDEALAKIDELTKEEPPSDEEGDPPELSAALNRIAALESKQFNASWSHAVASGAALPVARPQYEAIKDAMGLEAAVGIIEGLRPGSSLPMERHSHSIDTPPPKQNDFSLAEKSAEMGLVSKTALATVKARR